MAYCRMSEEEWSAYARNAARRDEEGYQRRKYRHQQCETAESEENEWQCLYDELVKEQNYVCAVCDGVNSGNRQLAIDHDHETGEVRGLLCLGCNLALGHVNDSPVVLLQLASYLGAEPPVMPRTPFKRLKRRWRGLSLKEQKRDWELRKLYGITLAQFNTLLERQHGVCAGCGSINSANHSLGVDHNHETGKIRGLLCNKCNCAIGLARNSPAHLYRLASYLVRAGVD